MGELVEKQNVTYNYGGIGFGGLLTIVLITLKLMGYIAIPWLWVFAPLWIGFAIVLALLVIGLVIGGIALLIGAALDR
jgi:hypothetical protein